MKKTCKGILCVTLTVLLLFLIGCGAKIAEETAAQETEETVTEEIPEEESVETTETVEEPEESEEPEEPEAVEEPEEPAVPEEPEEPEEPATVEILGTEYQVDTAETVSLVGITSEELDSVLEPLAQLTNLQTVELMDGEGNCALTYEDLTKIAQVAPQAALRYDFVLFGKEVAADAEEIEYKYTSIRESGVEELRSVLPFMTKLTRLVLDCCGISNETAAQLRDDFPEKNVVWRVSLCGIDGSCSSYLTDTDTIWFNKLGDSEAEKLKYFTKIKNLDIGHSIFTKVDFLNYMPDLEVLILAINYASDISPITTCTKLEYLEVFSTQVSDLTPLASLTNLEHLNISNLPNVTDLSPIYGLTKLKRVRASMNDQITPEQEEELRQALPADCVVEFSEDGIDPTGGTWRNGENGYVERYQQLRDTFGYPPRE